MLPIEIKALEDAVEDLLVRELKGEDVKEELAIKLEELRKVKVEQAESSTSL